jgi:protein disulfide-isomerase-like protein
MIRSIFTLVIISTTAFGIELTPSNWDEKTFGKTVFLKFFTPWCGHCKAMKPAWDKMMTKYENSEDVLIADVDCIGNGKMLCSKVGVQGFPTIKYGNPEHLDDYTGSRDLKALESFVLELKPHCNVATLKHCDKDQRAFIEAHMHKEQKHFENVLGTENEERTRVENIFKEEVRQLQESYQTLSQEKEKNLRLIADKHNLEMVKSLLNHKKKTTKNDL